MVKFRCAHCSQKIGVPDEYAGRMVRCPRCRHAVRVPETIEALAGGPAAPTEQTPPGSEPGPEVHDGPPVMNEPLPVVSESPQTIAESNVSEPAPVDAPHKPEPEPSAPMFQEPAPPPLPLIDEEPPPLELSSAPVSEPEPLSPRQEELAPIPVVRDEPEIDEEAPVRAEAQVEPELAFEPEPPVIHEELTPPAEAEPAHEVGAEAPEAMTKSEGAPTTISEAQIPFEDLPSADEEPTLDAFKAMENEAELDEPKPHEATAREAHQADAPEPEAPAVEAPVPVPLAPEEPWAEESAAGWFDTAAANQHAEHEPATHVIPHDSEPTPAPAPVVDDELNLEPAEPPSETSAAPSAQESHLHLDETNLNTNEPATDLSDLKFYDEPAPTEAAEDELPLTGEPNSIEAALPPPESTVPESPEDWIEPSAQPPLVSDDAVSAPASPAAEAPPPAPPPAPPAPPAFSPLYGSTSFFGTWQPEISVSHMGPPPASQPKPPPQPHAPVPPVEVLDAPPGHETEVSGIEEASGLLKDLGEPTEPLEPEPGEPVQEVIEAPRAPAPSVPRQASPAVPPPGTATYAAVRGLAALALLAGVAGAAMYWFPSVRAYAVPVAGGAVAAALLAFLIAVLRATGAVLPFMATVVSGIALLVVLLASRGWLPALHQTPSTAAPAGPSAAPQPPEVATAPPSGWTLASTPVVAGNVRVHVERVEVRNPLVMSDGISATLHSLPEKRLIITVSLTGLGVGRPTPYLPWGQPHGGGEPAVLTDDAGNHIPLIDLYPQTEYSQVREVPLNLYPDKVSSDVLVFDDPAPGRSLRLELPVSNVGTTGQPLRLWIPASMIQR